MKEYDPGIDNAKRLPARLIQYNLQIVLTMLACFHQTSGASFRRKEEKRCLLELNLHYDYLVKIAEISAGSICWFDEGITDSFGSRSCYR
jgi:hypothetical protein